MLLPKDMSPTSLVFGEEELVTSRLLKRVTSYNNLLPGDVLADRGFHVGDGVIFYYASLKMPAFICLLFTICYKYFGLRQRNVCLSCKYT